MPNNPKFSIITTSYNYANYIKETIESVKNQTYTNWEMIIVDDGSKDNSIEVINEYCQNDSRIKLYTHPNNENRGLAATTRLGIEKSSSEWIIFLESDDTIVPNYIEEKLKIINKYPEVGFIFNDVNLFGDNDRVSQMNDGYVANIHKILDKIKFPANLKKEFKKNNIIPTFSCVTVKKEILNNVDFDNCTVKKWLDYYLWTQLANKCLFYFIDKKLTNWRMSKKSYVNNEFIDYATEYYFKRVQIPDNLSNKKYKLWHRLCYLRKMIFSFHLSIKNKKLSFENKNYSDNKGVTQAKKKMFSIIIPTMQKNINVLNKLVNILDNSECIGEIIIIDNSLKGYDYPSNKIKVIVPEKNLYVNPSWNLGIKSAKFDYFGILNDDLLIPKDLCKKVLDFICKTKNVGHVGLDSNIIVPTSETEFNTLPKNADKIMYKVLKKTIHTWYWGSAFFGYKNNYIKIPDEMKIWCGDNFLLKNNKDKGFINYQIKNIEIKHLHSYTSSSKEFDDIKRADRNYYAKIDPKIMLEQETEETEKPFYKKIFELKNSNDGTHKEITVLGIKVSIKKDFSKYAKQINKSEKPICLYIDSNILQPDTNCGDRASFGYIKLLKQMNIDVYFMPVGIHCRFENCFDIFNKLNIDIIKTDKNKTNMLLIEKWLQVNGNKLDYIFINRPDVWNKIYKFTKIYAPQAKLIYQGHDIHYLRLQRQQELNRTLNLTYEIIKYQELEHSIWDNADIILYFSKAEVDIVKKYNPKACVYDVPLYTDDVFKNSKYNAGERKDLLFVGSFNHKPNLDGILWFVNKVFPKVQSLYEDIKLYIVGSNPTKEIINLANKNIIVTGYISDEELSSLYGKVRLVVAPLLYGAGIKGKIIEALQQGLPVLTTDIGAEGIANDNNAISIANTEKEWISNLCDLYDDMGKLNEMSFKSNLLVKTNFSKEYAKKSLTAMFN